MIRNLLVLALLITPAFADGPQLTPKQQLIQQAEALKSSRIAASLILQQPQLLEQCCWVGDFCSCAAYPNPACRFAPYLTCGPGFERPTTAHVHVFTINDGLLGHGLIEP